MTAATMGQMAEITRRVADGELSLEALQVLIDRGSRLGFPSLYKKVLEEARGELRGLLEERWTSRGRALIAIAAASGEKQDWEEARTYVSKQLDPLHWILLLSDIAKLGKEEDIDSLKNAIADSRGDLSVDTDVFSFLMQESVDGGYSDVLSQLKHDPVFESDYAKMISLARDYQYACSQKEFDKLFKRTRDIEHEKCRDRTLVMGIGLFARYSLPSALVLYEGLDTHSIVKILITPVIAGALAKEGMLKKAREIAENAKVTNMLCKTFLAIAVHSEDQRDFDTALYNAKYQKSRYDGEGARVFAEIAGALNKIISED